MALSIIPFVLNSQLCVSIFNFEEKSKEKSEEKMARKGGATVTVTTVNTPEEWGDLCSREVIFVSKVFPTQCPEGKRFFVTTSMIRNLHEGVAW